jgi:hypothetical protein
MKMSFRLNKFYPNQVKYGNLIINNIKSNTTFTTIIANMMSGKSGLYNYIMYNLLYEKFISNVYVLTANREKELLNQMNADKTYYFNEFNNIKNGSCNYLPTNINVYNGVNMEKLVNNNLPDIKNDSLIIIDESHYGQSVGQTLAKYLYMNSISLDCSNEIELKAKNIYVVSISATPFSEISDFIHKKQNKKIYVIPPGDNYYGVEYFYENDLFHSSDLNPLDTVIKTMNNNNKIGYLLVRSHSDKHEYIEELCNDLKVDCKFYISSNESDYTNSDFLQIKPQKLTVICICNLLSMGKQIYKKHIVGMYESALNPKVDTALQRMRMCGYYDSPPDFPIYISSKLLEEDITGHCQIERYISLVNHDGLLSDDDASRLIIPSYAMNIDNEDNKFNKFTDEKFAIIPILINIDASSNRKLFNIITRMFYSYGSRNYNYIKNRDKEIRALLGVLIKDYITNNKYLSDDQKNELLEEIDELHISIRDMLNSKDTRYNNSYQEHIKCFNENIPCSFLNKEKVNVILIHNETETSLENDKIKLIVGGYTESPWKEELFNDKRLLIPLTNNKEIYGRPYGFYDIDLNNYDKLKLSERTMYSMRILIDEVLGYVNIGKSCIIDSNINETDTRVKKGIFIKYDTISEYGNIQLFEMKNKNAFFKKTFRELVMESLKYISDADNRLCSIKIEFNNAKIPIMYNDCIRINRIIIDWD